MIWEWLYDWWNARKVHEMRLGAAVMFLAVANGELTACELREKVRTMWFGRRMNIIHWHAIMRRLEQMPGVFVEERWVQESKYHSSLTRFFRMQQEQSA